MKNRMTLAELGALFASLQHRAFRGEPYELSFVTEVAIV